MDHHCTSIDSSVGRHLSPNETTRDQALAVPLVVRDLSECVQARFVCKNGSDVLFLRLMQMLLFTHGKEKQ